MTPPIINWSKTHLQLAQEKPKLWQSCTAEADKMEYECLKRKANRKDKVLVEEGMIEDEDLEEEYKTKHEDVDDEDNTNNDLNGEDKTEWIFGRNGQDRRLRSERRRPHKKYKYKTED